MNFFKFKLLLLLARSLHFIKISGETLRRYELLLQFELGMCLTVYPLADSGGSIAPTQLQLESFMDEREKSRDRVWFFSKVCCVRKDHFHAPVCEVTGGQAKLVTATLLLFKQVLGIQEENTSQMTSSLGL